MYLAACGGYRAYGVQVPDGVQEGPILSGTSARYDPRAGGRWLPGRAKLLRVSAGNLVYDVDIGFNNRGYRTRRDFAPRKESPDHVRLAVLGDSFTAGIYLETPWPDRLEEELRRAGGRPRVEVYNLAVDGSGLANWHSIFFQELVPELAFDALVIACWGDDLRRDFIAYAGREDGIYFTYLADGERPATEAELVAAHGARMGKLISVVDDATLTDVRKRLRPWKVLPPRPYFVEFLGANWRRWARENQERRWAPSTAALPERPSRGEIESYLATTLGDAKARRLAEILDECRRRGVPVILATVPYRDVIAARNASGIAQTDQRELAQIAAAFETHQFDGYQAFADVRPEQVEDYFLPGDRHWNQRGSDRFARAFSAWLRHEGFLRHLAGRRG